MNGPFPDLDDASKTVVVEKIKTLSEVHKEKERFYNTSKNTFEMFKIGSRVKVISPCVDFYFFYDETGIVVSNSGKYLGICVEFDKPRYFEDGSIQTGFGFNPKDLWIESIENRCDILDI